MKQNTKIWQHCVIGDYAIIGYDGNICSHCFIEDGVVIGDRVTIKNGTMIYDGATIEDDVFIGPNVTFTNDHFPKSKNKEFKLEKILVEQGASIGAGVVILPGVTIGKNSLIGAGSVVTKDVPAGEIWVGNPARFLRKIND